MFGNITCAVLWNSVIPKAFCIFALFGTFAFEAQECCLGGSQGFISIIALKNYSSVVFIDAVLKVSDLFVGWIFCSIMSWAVLLDDFFLQLLNNVGLHDTQDLLFSGFKFSSVSGAFPETTLCTYQKAW